MITPEQQQKWEQYKQQTGFKSVSTAPKPNVYDAIDKQIISRQPEEKGILPMAVEQTGQTISGLPGKLMEDVEAGASDIQKGDVLKGVAKAGLRTAGDVAGTIFAPVSSVVGATLERTGVQKGIDWLGQQIAEKSGITDIKAVQDWAIAHPNAAEDFGRAMNIILATKGGAEPLSKIAKKGAEIIETIPTKVFDTVRNAKPLAKLRGIASEKAQKVISEDVDSLLKATRGVSKKVQEAESRGVDLSTTLKDPSVFKGIKVENNKIVPDEAVSTIQQRIDKVMDAKREMLPKIDTIIPESSREIIRQKAIENIKGKYTPADEVSLIKRINEQVDALPETLKPSQIDSLRAQFRASARDAKGQMKSQSEYAALENAARDTVFDITDNLPVSGAKEYKALNDYVKNMITTKDFLNETLRNQVVKGGRLKGYTLRVIGSIAGATHGILGAIAGSEVGGLVADIITNNQLGNSVKMRLIRNITDEPAILKQAQDLLGEIKDINVPLLEKGSGYRSQTVGGTVIPLGKKTESSISAQEKSIAEAQKIRDYIDSLKANPNEVLKLMEQNPIITPPPQRGGSPNISRQNTPTNTINIKPIESNIPQALIKVKSDLSSYIKEFLSMKSGEIIDNPNETIPISPTVQFTRQSFKHFIESRQKEGSTLKDINYLVKKAPEVITNPEINILNPKQKQYPNSTLLGRFYEDSGKAVMVILDEGKEVRDIISLHFKNKRDFEKLYVE